MDCPACRGKLESVESDGVTVDVCHDGCGGIWFDNFELSKLDEPHEPAGDLLLTGCQAEAEVEAQRTCPRCGDVPMMQHFWSVERHVVVDECPGCAGFWLDAGELAEIREKFASEAERTRAAEQYFDGVFDEQLRAMRDESEAKARSARKVANAFRFLCPTWYIPGKQDWGAF